MKPTALGVLALVAFVFYGAGTGFIRVPVSKADSGQFSNFNARWNYSIGQIETVKKALPASLETELKKRVSPIAKGN